MDPRNSCSLQSRPTPLAQCPQCEKVAITTQYQVQQFEYGTSDQACTITATLPVQTCKSCGFQFLDDVGETAKHEAVCRHLDVLTPAEIAAIRKTHGISQVELSRLTGIGTASLSRWESGSLIQSKSHDCLLRILRTMAGYRLFRESCDGQTCEEGFTASAILERFPSIEQPALARVRQKAFRLRTTACTL